VNAGGRVSKSLDEKTYTAAMVYSDNHRETQTAQVRSGGTVELRFTYTIPGTLNISAASAGTLSIDGGAGERINAGARVSKSLSEKTYIVSMTYADGYGETYMAEVKSGGVSELRFTYQERPIPSDMVRINGGTFMMGSPESEAERLNNEDRHQVTVSGFLMGKYEVTQAEYQALMGNNPSNFKGDKLPVEQVSWFDAAEYCNKRSLREGLTPAYTISGSGDNRMVTWNRNAPDQRSAGYRLPTEAEWEYACRAGTTTPFSTGGNITTSQANYDGNSPYNNNAKGSYRETTTPVGSFPSNAWGLYDMHGNVEEWVWDWIGSYSSGVQTDPLGASSGSYRVVRGGSWHGNGQVLRSAYRYGSTPSVRGSYLGFRLVRPM
jgi:formylglycine-generating enzyme required for sulfatase activity